MSVIKRFHCIFKPIWPTDLEKHIMTDLDKGFKRQHSTDLAKRLVYSDRFCRLIWTGIFRPIWPTDLDNYIPTDLADGFGHVNSDRFS